MQSCMAEEDKIKFSLYSRYYSEECNEWRGPSPQLSAWATQLRRNVAAVASRWRHCVRFDRYGNRIPDLPHRLRCSRFKIRAIRLTARETRDIMNSVIGLSNIVSVDFSPFFILLNWFLTERTVNCWSLNLLKS